MPSAAGHAPTLASAGQSPSSYRVAEAPRDGSALTRQSGGEVGAQQAVALERPWPVRARSRRATEEGRSPQSQEAAGSGDQVKTLATWSLTPVAAYTRSSNVRSVTRSAVAGWLVASSRLRASARSRSCSWRIRSSTVLELLELVHRVLRQREDRVEDIHVMGLAEGREGVARAGELRSEPFQRGVVGSHPPRRLCAPRAARLLRRRSAPSAPQSVALPCRRGRPARCRRRGGSSRRWSRYRRSGRSTSNRGSW